MRPPARGIAAAPLVLVAFSLTALGLVAPPVASASTVVPTPYSASVAAADAAIPASPRAADPTVGPRVTRQQIMQNALGWLAENVTYSQTAYSPGIADPKTLYRTDCSGFVSMAWETNVHTNPDNWNNGYVTWTLPDIATRLPSVWDLEPGDILDNIEHHVILFTGWVNKSAGVFTYIAETEPGMNMQAVDDESVVGGMISGYPFSDFVPYTYENVAPSTPPPGVTGDWDFNGTTDLLTLGGSTVSLWQGNGAGRFTYGKPAKLRDDFPAYVSVQRTVDFTGDHIPDVFAVDSNGIMWIIPGNAAGGFLPRSAIGKGWSGYQILAADNFNGGGAADVLAIAPNGALMLYPGSGKDSFEPVVRIGTGWTGMKLVATGAFQGPGTDDLIATDLSGALWMYPDNGRGVLGRRVRIGNGWNGWHVFSPGDFTGDHNPDLIGTDASGNLWLYPGNGKGSFLPRVRLGNGWGSLDVF